MAESTRRMNTKAFWEHASCCKINGSCDGQSNAWQIVSIANQTAGNVNVDEPDVCQCHLGNSRGTPEFQHTQPHNV